MTRGQREALLVAAALMAVGTALPWGQARTMPWHEVQTFGGFGRGAEVVLVVAVLLATASLLRSSVAAVLVAGLAALAALVAFDLLRELPDTLHNSVPGAYETQTGIGVTVVLLGALVACGTATAIVVRAINQATLRSMARGA